MAKTLKPIVVGLTILASLLAYGCDAERIANERNALSSGAAASKNNPRSANKEASNGAMDPDSAATKPSMPGKSMPGKSKWNFKAYRNTKFKDSIESNVDAPAAIKELVFTNTDGSKIKMADYLEKKNVLLVFTQGFNGKLCPFCTTQTSRLVANYEKFQKRDCEVIVVYPGPEDYLDEFLQAALETEKEQVDDVPFPIVLDRNFKATDFFDIHSMHAHPSTYLIDKQGNAKFAYVGIDSTADRPSIKALLNRLDNLQ